MFDLKYLRLTILSLFLATLLSPSPSLAGHPQEPCPKFDWEHVPLNQWVRLFTCRDAPRKVFHGASALAADRNEILFFGADTHHKDYDNSVYRIHLRTLEWSKDYESDSLEEYLLTEEGYAVTTTGRPWAMHTFDAWDYVPDVHKFIVTSSPQHAHQAFELFKDNEKVRDRIKPATWLYDPDTKEWQLVKANTPPLFAQGQVWDPIGRQLVGHQGNTTSHYDPFHQEWTTYVAPSVLGWHRKLVFDTFAGKVLSLGKNGGSSDLWSYSPTSILWKRVTTPSQPPPANGATMAYSIHQHVLLYLANDSDNQYSNPSGKSLTFVYVSENQTWTRLSVQSPPLYGMNYLMQYVPSHRVFLHFERAPNSNGRLAVWAFRFQAPPPLFP